MATSGYLKLQIKSFTSSSFNTRKRRTTSKSLTRIMKVITFITTIDLMMNPYHVSEVYHSMNSRLIEAIEEL